MVVLLGYLIRLLLVAIVLYIIVYVYRALRKAMSVINNPMRPSEACPSCHRLIQVSGENMVCPHCGTKLGRTVDGKLIIRVN